MRVALAVLCLFVAAADLHAADPVYLDELVETPLAKLQSSFRGLKKEGCYQISGTEFLHLTIDKKDQKPWRVVLSSIAPCRRPDEGPAMEVRSRSGVKLGDTQIAVVERLGRPDTATPPETDQRRLGEVEYFYVCRVSEGCGRHTSVFVKDGVVTAIAEWYSQ